MLLSGEAIIQRKPINSFCSKSGQLDSLKKPYHLNTKEPFIKYKILRFPDLVKEQQVIILLGFLKGTLPCPIHEMFKLHVPVNTRAVQHFEIPRSLTNYRAFSLSITAPRAWNSIVSKLFKDINEVPKNRRH